MTEPSGPDLRVIACNVDEGSSGVSSGSIAYVLLTNPGAGDHDRTMRIMLLIRSRGGRWIEKWEAMRRLRYFRVKTIPAGHPLYERLRLAASPEHLQRLQSISTRVRS